MYIKYFRFLVTIPFCAIASYSTVREKPRPATNAGKGVKREFRGVRIQTTFQGKYKDMTPARVRKDFIRRFNYLQAYGINAIIFQVHPEVDAFYKSDIEPWSHFFTGEQDIASAGEFDSMTFLIQERHGRNMGLHTQLDPYRASTAGNTRFADSHIYHKHPEWSITYNKQILFDPGLPESRQFIYRVVRNIVGRYDMDAIHMDDYFYPYLAAGMPFPNDNGFRKYGLREGHSKAQGNDWCRENMNTLIRGLRRTILLTKLWVRFDISLFDIYRNKRSTADGSGSNINSLQSYGDLYADITYWIQQGWIDYNIPRIYWEIGHPAADYITSIKWQDKNANGGHLYIKQDVARTMKANQLTHKMRYERVLPHVRDNCFWSANEILWNNKGIADGLKQNYHRYPTLIPAYTHMCNHPSKDVSKLKAEWTPKSFLLHQQVKQSPANPELASYFVIYRFNDKKPIDTSDPSKVVAITQETGYLMPYEKGKVKYRYMVTTVDRLHNESEGKTKKVKL